MLGGAGECHKGELDWPSLSVYASRTRKWDAPRYNRHTAGAWEHLNHVILGGEPLKLAAAGARADPRAARRATSAGGSLAGDAERQHTGNLLGRRLPPQHAATSTRGPLLWAATCRRAGAPAPALAPALSTPSRAARASFSSAASAVRSPASPRSRKTRCSAPPQASPSASRAAAFLI